MSEMELGPLTLDQSAIDNIFKVPNNEGVFKPEQHAYLQDISKRRPMIFLAFAPKAAGTFLRQAAIIAADGDLVRIVHAQGGRDAQPYLPTLIAYQYGGICAGTLVTHAHMQALPANRRFIEAFNLRPVVMIRSIPDMLASYCDMLDTDEQARRDGLNCLIPSDFPSLSLGQKADLLVDILGPWYASYFATWFEFARDDPRRVLMVHYPEFRAAPAEVLAKVLAHSGVSVSRADCEDAIREAQRNKDRLRFNRGETGRGNRYFGPDRRERLARMLSYYPSVAPFRDELMGSA